MRACGEKILGTLGMARRAGALLVGQDKVLAALKSGGRYVVFVTCDCAANVTRRLETAAGRGRAEIILIKGTDRAELGAALGVTAAQTAALPAESGFVKKIHTICDRSDANE